MQLLKNARCEGLNPAGDSELEERLFIDALTYLLQGLPAKVSQETVQRLSLAAASKLVIPPPSPPPSPPPPTAMKPTAMLLQLLLRWLVLEPIFFAVARMPIPKSLAQIIIQTHQRSLQQVVAS